MSRVALFLPSLEGGGAERSIASVGVGLQRAGVDVSLLLAEAKGEYLDQFRSLSPVGFGCARTLKAMVPLARWLRENRPAAILSALDQANVVALLAARLAGFRGRVVVSIRNHLTIEYQGKGRKDQAVLGLARKLYPRASDVVAVSHGVASDAANLLLMDRRKIRTIYNPVVNEELRRGMLEPVEHPWLHPDEPPVVLTAGRLNEQKDHATLLTAFARVTAPARLMILGQGALRPALEAQARELGIADRFALPGFAANPFPAMRACGVFALSSRFEGLPGALIQAMACGAPLVSTLCPSGPEEILEDGRWGALVPVGDAAALGEAIQRALTSPRPRYPAAATDRFTEEATLRQYREVLGA